MPIAKPQQLSHSWWAQPAIIRSSLTPGRRTPFAAVITLALTFSPGCHPLWGLGLPRPHLSHRDLRRARDPLDIVLPHAQDASGFARADTHRAPAFVDGIVHHSSNSDSIPAITPCPGR
jgi:hypothetical protein